MRENPASHRASGRPHFRTYYETVFCLAEPDITVIPMRKILLSLALCGPAWTAHAQHFHTDDVPIYEGVWNVRFADQRAARLEVRDWNGTWRETGSTRALPAVCRGKKFPITVQHSTPEEFEFTVWGTAIDASCPETSYVFKPLDGKTLEASIEPAGKATMKRVRP
jgi:hypothetical protein